MNLRLALLELIKKYHLSTADHKKLQQLAGFRDQPHSIEQHLRTGIGLLGAILGGLGILFWIAANWGALAKAGRFALLEICVTVMLSSAWLRPAARLPLSILGFLACGGLFAQFGQTYQTGADPWQLFALWSLLTLPLCFSVRHQALWTAWAAVALTGALLFSSISSESNPFQTGQNSWMATAAVALAFHFSPERWLGKVTWPMRLSILYVAASMAWGGVYSILDEDHHGLYFLTMIGVAVLGMTFGQRRGFDVFAISALALSANVLLLSGFARVLINMNAALTAAILLIGCIAAAAMAVTVKIILYLSRIHAKEHIA